MLGRGEGGAAEQQVQLDQVQQMEQELHRIQQQKRLLAQQEKLLVLEKSRFEVNIFSPLSSTVTNVKKELPHSVKIGEHKSFNIYLCPLFTSYVYLYSISLYNMYPM